MKVLNEFVFIWTSVPFTAPAPMFFWQKRKKEKKELKNPQKHGGKIKYAGHYFIA